MRSGRLGTVAALAAAALMISSAVAALTINFRDPSFESPGAPNGSFTYYPNGSVLDNAWKVGDGGVTLFGKDYVHDGVTYNAQSGNQFVALSAPNNDSVGAVTYTLTAVPNVDYDFSFYLGNAPSNRFGATVNVWIIINGHEPPLPLKVNNSQVTAHGVNWQREPGSFHFAPQDIGGAPNTTVQLRFENGNSGGGFVGLDSFSVAPCLREAPERGCEELDGGGVRPGPPSPWR